jgi:tetratricopeptide (TPR) repeat protein
MWLRKSVLLLTVAMSLSVLAGCGGAETRKARYIESGKEYFEQSNYEKARVEFSNAAQIDPKDAEARYLIGTVAEKLGNPREAVGQYQAAVDANPNFNDARASLARLYLFGGITDKALELVELGLKDEPNNAKLLVVRAAAKLRLGDEVAAFADAEQASKLAPDDPYAIALLASMYKNKREYDKAVAVVRAGIEKLPKNVDLRVVLADLAMAQGQNQEAETQLKKVIEIEPTKLAHRYQLGRFYMATKNIDAAELALRDALNAVEKDVQNEARLALVDFLASQRSPGAAEKQIQQFIVEQPKDTSLRLTLGGHYERRGDKEKAQAEYRAVIEQADIKPDGLSARNRLAAMMMQGNDVDGAIKLIDEVLAANARDADALIMRGNIALARGDSAKAITDLRAVLRDQPNSVPVMRALARAHTQNKELTLAEETLRSAVQINPKDPLARFDLAQLLAQSGKPEQAESVLQQLVEESPDNVAALETLFKAQYGQRKWADARRTAVKLQEVQPDRAAGYYLQGMTEEAERKTDAAREAYQRALDKQPLAAEPLTALIRLDVADKKQDRALARLEQLIVREPKHSVAYNLQGELLIAKGDFDAAVKSFRKATEVSPTWWVPYRGMSIAELGAKRSDAAIAALKAGIAQSGAGAQALSADLAALHERLGRTDEAIKVYEELAQRDPKSLFAANNLAMLLVNYRSDKASFERAQQLAQVLSASDDPATLNTRGWVKYKAGEVQEALPLLQQAVSKAPDSPLLRYHLAMAQLKSGAAGEARKNLEVAVNAGQKFFGVEDAKAELEKLKVSG